jgi:hypothetical protein
MKLQEDEFSKYDLTEKVGDYQPMHKNMLTILKFLDGKKNILQAIVAVTATYLADKALIGTLDAVYIVTLSGIIFGTASIATTKFLYNNK